MCNTPTKAASIERLWNQQLKLKPHPKVPPGCCLGMLVLTFGDADELHRRNAEKLYPDSAHWQKVPQSYPDYLDKTFPHFFSCIKIHTLRILGLEHSSVVKHLLHMNKAWIQKKKKNPRRQGKKEKKRKIFALCYVHRSHIQLCPSSQGAAMNTAAVTHGKSTKSIKEERLSPVFLLSVLTTVWFAHECSHLLTETYPGHYHQSIVARELSNQTEI